MRCLYCETEISTYPQSGNCPNCGGTLPKVAQHQTPVRVCSVCGRESRSSFCPDCGRSLTGTAGVPTYAPAYDRPIPGRTCCSRCYSRDITFKKQGFRWGLGLFGFILIPFIGILLGFIGSKKLRYRCNTCSFKWTIG